MTERTPDDDLIREEEAEAAAAARRIGGRTGDEDEVPPEQRAVSEGGGGEAEGFELAEADLVDNAQHSDGRGEPMSDAFTPERESDLSGASYGEADHEHVSEVTDEGEGEAAGR